MRLFLFIFNYLRVSGWERISARAGTFGIFGNRSTITFEIVIFEQNPKT